MDKNVIRDYGTLIVAIYGVVQLWILSVYKLIWRKLLHKPKVEFYTKEMIEVGYGTLGPSLAISGTLVVLNREILVESISLQMIRKKDKAEYEFNWLFFRPMQFLIGANTGLPIEITSSFIITPKQTYKTNVFFVDNKRYDEIQPILKEIQIRWLEKTKISSSVPLQSPNYSSLFAEFIKGGDALDPYNSLQKKCYWEEGEYIVRIKVNTQHPKQCFEVSKSFVLTADDSKRLESNAFIVIAEICKQPGAVYNFAYPHFR